MNQKFEKFIVDERNRHDLRDMTVQGQFFARALTINCKRILFDIIGVNPGNKPRRKKLVRR